MENKDSFLNIDNINPDNKDSLLKMRKVLVTSLVNNAQKKDCKKMYLISLAIFSEFERLTRHITDSDIIKH